MLAEGELSGKTAVISDGTTVAGRHIATAFAKAGANVVLGGGLDRKQGVETLTDIAQLGGQACFVEQQAVSLSECEHLLGEAEAAYGAVDIVVVTGAVLGGGTVTEVPAR